LAGIDAADMERVGQVARLYLIVHRRPPDPGGLAAYVRALREGRSLAELAAEFLASGEFTGRVAPGEALREIWRNAGGVGELPPSTGPLADDVAGLVTSEIVKLRLPLLPALYPHGVPLSDPAGYRLWLAHRRSALEAGAPIHSVSFVMVVTRDVPRAHAAAAISSALDQGALLDIVVRGWAPRWLKTLIAGRPGARLHRAPAWCRRSGMVERGLAAATGALVAVIDADNVLDPAAARILGGVDADIVLADDDLLDAEGLRHSPQFGCAWDPDRVRAAGATGLIAMRTALVQQAGGGAQNGDGGRLMRVAALSEPARIIHVPAVLLSRRSPEPPRDPARIAYPLPESPPRVSVIIPTRDRADLLRACTAGLLQRTAYGALELLIVDNGSTEPDTLRLLDDLAAQSRVRVLARPGPFNWSALNNAGVAEASGEVVLLLNNDIEVIEPGWLQELVAHVIRPEVGAVGAKLLYPDGRVQHAGVALGPSGRGTHVWRFSAGEAPGYLDQLRVARQVSAVTGACLATRRDVYQQVGGCDEALPITWNDVDLCLRVRELGLQVVWTPHARLTHHEQATRGTDDSPERQAMFRQAQDIMRSRWGGAMDRDPFWSPNLRPAEGPDEIEPRLAVD
jgi:GT2 family glycosyltransferase